MNYVLLRPLSIENEARFGVLRRYKNKNRLTKGVSLAAEFPADAEFQMSDDFPDAIALVDVLEIIGSVLVVSSRVRDILEKLSVPDLEFLAVNILNHKGRRVKESYSIINVLRVFDCVDKKETIWSPDALDPDDLDQVKNLTLDEMCIEPGLRVFRPKGLRNLIVARRELAKQLLDSGVRGLGVTEVADYES